jgi:SAM-dependent methyltransferase
MPPDLFTMRLHCKREERTMSSPPDVHHERRVRRGRRLWNLAARTHYRPLEDWMGPRVHEVALRHLDVRPGQHVLDIGCGTGGGVLALRESVGPEGRVVGVDNSPRMLATAERRVGEHGWANVQLRLADATRTRLGDGAFDAAMSLFALSAMPDVPAVVRAAYSALRPGGRLFVIDVRLRSRDTRLARASTGLLRLIYRTFAGFSGADVVDELRRVFDTVEPAMHATEPGDTITAVIATKAVAPAES